MRVGTGLLGDPFLRRAIWPDFAGIREVAARAEDLGFDYINVPESGHDPFIYVTVALENTKRLILGTSVAIAFPRTPMITAQIAWDLQKLSGGRFRLGIGTQVKGHNERRYSAPWMGPPGPRLREYIQCLRAIFQTFQDPSQPTFYTGQYYQLNLMTPFFNPGPIEHPHVPIYISAVNKHKARLAGEVCDGILPHPICTAKYLREVLLPNVEAGARKAGRQLSDIDIVAEPLLVTGKNKEELQAGKRAMQRRIAFYASTRTYLSVLELHGRRDLGMKLHDLSLEGKWREMANLITDDVIDEFGVVATYDELPAKLRERWGGIFTSFGLSEFPQDDQRQARNLIEALRRM
jgi:probable F420-dependent oxidoreductase